MRSSQGVESLSRLLRGLLLCTLLLSAFTPRSMAQDNPYVIKSGSNYLAHVYNSITSSYELQGTTTFSPDCIWYSGTTYNSSGYEHNYYFDDGTNLRFLSVDWGASKTLTLSASLPATHLLRNIDTNYYFYDWDDGLARGKRHWNVNSQSECTANWEDSECWEVYWLVYQDNIWKTYSSSKYNAGDVDNAETESGVKAARFYQVTITEHALEMTSASTTGLADLSDIQLSYSADPLTSHSCSATVNNGYAYTPAYTTYAFTIGETAETHNYYGGSDHGSNTPTTVTETNENVTYSWSLSGDGAAHLSFSNSGTTSTSPNDAPTLYYLTENTEYTKTATLSLTVTYAGGATQTKTATVTVVATCGNPAQASAPVVTYEGVTVSWNDRNAESYTVYWSTSSSDLLNGSSATVTGATSYTITGLADNTTYHYTVKAACSSTDPTSLGSFTTKQTPGLLIYGAVFGGGRMANVTGKTEVVIINCDSISAVYGGNDIAGQVQGVDGSTITLGVNSGETYASYGTTSKVKIGSVYGGGNGYYAYDGYAPSAAVGTTVLTDQQFESGVTEVGGVNSYLTSGYIPTILKTAIVVTNNLVTVDSLFGGAKNAFIIGSGTNTSITINGGTIFSVFGGNNYGGTLASSSIQQIAVAGTSTRLTDAAKGKINTYTEGFGRDFGVRYLFGGGNKVAGRNVVINITGGQLDTVFGGGNSADVEVATVTVNCSLGAATDGVYGKTITSAIGGYSGGITSITDGYAWNGSGLYNVRTLFGGNNAADWAYDINGTRKGVPSVTLTSGSVGTVYGGGNAGDMKAYANTTISNSLLSGGSASVNYGTHVQMNSANMLVDMIYGGCQLSNVDYSTWVQVQNGHVGTVYGGCNISGDVGSTQLYPSAASKTTEYQTVKGGTYVVATGGHIYKNVFAGSNGYYHCNDGIKYISGIDFDDADHYYIGTDIPTHNETTVIISKESGSQYPTVEGNVYAGGNLACVGFTYASKGSNTYPALVGLARVLMDGGQVNGDVFGGGNMASVNGSNTVLVSGGTIGGSLYGGNDRTGLVADMTNRVLDIVTASDSKTSISEVHTYVKVTGNPEIGSVYGGGNGAYEYNNTDYCDPTDLPIQSNTFVDINLAGGTDSVAGGHIGTVYGGGDGVTVTGFVKVFFNVAAASNSYHNVSTIFGGNNKGDLSLVPDIILLKGKVNTVYGGCNQGAMTGSATVTRDVDYDNTVDSSYTNIGSFVRLPNKYKASSSATAVSCAAVVTGNVYGGCRMNGVTNNSLVIVEGGSHTCGIFGGSDISGEVSGTSRVIVAGGTVGDVYGGGNGNYTYNNGTVTSGETTVATGVTAKPYCTSSRVDMQAGTCTRNLYAGGYAGECGTTYLQMAGGTVEKKIFGGGNLAGVDGTSTIMMVGGTVETGVYGGCNAQGAIDGAVTVNINGGTVGTSSSSRADGIFGGGYGHSTTTGSNVTVNIGLANAAEGASAIIYSDIYGGSALGVVNASTSNTTTVNVLNGTITGNVYGGGLGAATLNDDNDYINYKKDTTEATVKGNVQVTIGQDGGSTYLFFPHSGTSYGNIFGCNNLAGSPKGTVNVDVYETGHTPSDAYPDPEPADENGVTTQTAYAIAAVYGGGNLANYVPTTVSAPNVHIHNCDNTIEYVYGGGNAAATPSTNVTIDGGRFAYVFAGGNGYGTGNPGANVGYTSYTSTTEYTAYTYSDDFGNVSVTMNGGIVDQVFGGSNTKGAIKGSTSIVIPGTTTCKRIIKELYGGGNRADSDGDIEITLPCAASSVVTVFCGANNANVNGNITLNVEGGTYSQIFAGNNAGGTITGNVTLNLYGGTIGSAFGGCNAGGSILGTITVNVDSTSACPLTVDYVYGGGNQAAYTPTDATITSPMVNILRGSVQQDVYGGGYGSAAAVTSNPRVIMGSRTNDGDTPIVFGNIYGGGSAALVNGGTTVKVVNKSYVKGNVYGGGNAATVTGNTNVQIGDAEE